MLAQRTKSQGECLPASPAERLAAMVGAQLHLPRITRYATRDRYAS